MIPALLVGVVSVAAGAAASAVVYAVDLLVAAGDRWLVRREQAAWDQRVARAEAMKAAGERRAAARESVRAEALAAVAERAREMGGLR